MDRMKEFGICQIRQYRDQNKVSSFEDSREVDIFIEGKGIDRSW
jgi:hypothetical protein